VPDWTTALPTLRIIDDSVRGVSNAVLGTLVLRRGRAISVYMLVIDAIVRRVEDWMVEVIRRLLVQVTN